MVADGFLNESRNQTHPSWVRFIVGIVGVFRAGCLRNPFAQNPKGFALPRVKLIDLTMVHTRMYLGVRRLRPG
ncbi:hypothetical protein NECAME_06224 [Necator americanus]|uniref:Uncharacterized protein n=1 Tax=Necator americanus TaxID=51031 RepID=W2TVY5_NECAM|nr:hypothetical protein NECAME_06224 [Necator americanus]ETN85804.1 hypothetical protein NECAME_06224 [Necator americanus]